MKFPNRRRATITNAILSTTLVGMTILATQDSSNASAADDQTQQVQTTAQAAVVAWQTLFVEQPQPGAPGPNLLQPVAAAMTPSGVTAFLSRATRAAALLFTGDPLQTLTDSLHSEVQNSSSDATAALATADGTPGSEPDGAFTICIGGGASDFNFTNVAVDGGMASVDLTANAWTTNVDFATGQLPRLDTAQGTGAYHLELSLNATGQWLVTRFQAAPVGS